MKIGKKTDKYTKANATVPSIVRQVVSKYRNKTAILFEDQKWTFHDLNTYSNKVANMLLKNGFKSGDTIALFMTNCPEYVGILIGASTIGVKVALINYNLRNKGLYHCITIADCSGIIYENTLEEAIDNIHEQFDSELQKKCYCCSGNPNTSFGQSFDTEVEEQSDEPVPLLKDPSIHGNEINAIKDYYCYSIMIICTYDVFFYTIRCIMLYLYFWYYWPTQSCFNTPSKVRLTQLIVNNNTMTVL